MANADKIHTIESHNYEGDNIRFIDYGEYGLTIETRYNGVTVDMGLGPDEIPALIDWLTKIQQRRTA